MGILADYQIKHLSGTPEGMITPFAESSPPGQISYGLSSYGYDMRLGNRFLLAKALSSNLSHTMDDREVILDPKQFDPSFFQEVVTDRPLKIPAHGFVLAESLETFQIPRGVLGLCVGKSTYARCGLVVGITPLEPEWRGKVTIELSNTTPLPIRVYSGEGIAQVLFLTPDVDPCERSYADRRGVYQDQSGITLPRTR